LHQSAEYDNLIHEVWRAEPSRRCHGYLPKRAHRKHAHHRKGGGENRLRPASTASLQTTHEVEQKDLRNASISKGGAGEENSVFTRQRTPTYNSHNKAIVPVARRVAWVGSD